MKSHHNSILKEDFYSPLDQIGARIKVVLIMIAKEASQK